MTKATEKAKAITLRKQGKIYSEILEEVQVSKSTLSLWLRDVGLSKTQKQRLTAKKHAAQKRGGARRREIRLLETEEINRLCKRDIPHITDRELFLMGVALYWAEGAKSDGNRPGTVVDFGNSDPGMIRLFVTWLQQFGDVSEEGIMLRLHLHEAHRAREMELKKYWAKAIGVSISRFQKTNFKKHNPKTKRYKIGRDYIGLVSVRVKKSTTLNRRILGWIYAIIATQN